MLDLNKMTFSILKPDVLKEMKTGKILAKIEESGFHIVVMKTIKMNEPIIRVMYEELRDKPFFPQIVEFMNSGPVIVFVLYKKENTVKDFRELIGATNPKEAAPNTIRALFSQSIEANSIHGSESTEAAKREISIFFSQKELLSVL